MLLYTLNYLDGLCFTLLADQGKNYSYDVSFIDRRQNKLLYKTSLRPGEWAKLYQKNLLDIDIVIEYRQALVLQINFLETLKNKRVFIRIESYALGDTIAWLPYCLKFQEYYDCKVILVTFRNALFKSVYPELEFVKPDAELKDIYAAFNLGVYWDNNKEPYHPGTRSLQQAASDILCLPSEEIEPRINFKPSKKRPYEEPYVCIGTRSTAECKHWHGWAELVDALKALGYRVIEMSLDAQEYGAERLKDTSLNNTMNVLHHAELFIGLSSGLSWLNWAIKKKTVMISNFTESFYEFQSRCVRITKTSVCHGCWNDVKHKFDRGNWNWCPRHENTARQFECHRSITLDDVLPVVLQELQSSAKNEVHSSTYSDSEALSC